MASCFAKLIVYWLTCYVCEGQHVLSAFRFSQVDRNALLVPPYASEPWTCSIYVELSPHTQGIADTRWLNLDDLRPKLAIRCNAEFSS